MMNIVDEIFSRADRSAIALIEGETMVAYGDLEVAMESAARWLADLPSWPGPGSRVAVSLPNGVAHIVWSLALLRLGATLVPVPGELAPPERVALVKTTACAAVLAGDGQPWGGPDKGSCAVGTGGDVRWHVLVPEVLETDAAAGLAGLSAALIRFSSGTTGTSKGVVLSHQTLIERVRACNAGLAIGPDDRVLWILPMAHHFAVSIVLYLMHGATTVLAKSHLGAHLMAAIESSRATVLYASPYHYGLLVHGAAARPCASLRLAVSTAAALPLATARAFLEKFGLPLTQGLGIIEAGLPVLNTRDARANPEAVGHAQPGFEVRIGQPDGAGVGEVLLKGPGLFDAYLSPWQTRQSVLDQGWFRTGDLGKLDESGRLTLCGRLKSVINIAGLKCFPEEIEAVLDSHPLVKESRVFARPHPDTGSVPVAELVPAVPGQPPRAVDLITHCRAHLAAYKVPVRFQTVQALARTPSGKILRA